jgi:catechol 2,3-dioxygenase-like lactoylglutathione lyase family enzyme
MDKPLIVAMRSMTISTPEPDQLIDLIANGLGWEIRETGPIGHALEAVWGIESGSAGETFTILAAPGADRGMIRVVKGADRYPSRQIGARWSGVEIVVMSDIDGLCERLCGYPSFRLTKAPENADFSDVGANIHRFFHGRPVGGTHFMFTMAITQPREHAFPSADANVGQIFSIPLVSADYDRSFRFYRDTLGMVPMLEDHLESGIWHSTWSLPEGLAVELSILRGDTPALGFGGIELQGYDRSVIDPVPFIANRLDGGTGLASFTTADIDKVFVAVAGSPDARIITAPLTIADAPYSGARVFTFLGPGGERMEIVEERAV